MTKLSYKLILVVCLICLAPFASARDRGHVDNWNAGRVGDWRLGPERDGYGYKVYRWDGRHWRRAPGAATALGDGWVIGTDRRDGGFGIYRWNGRDWDRAPGAAVSIGGSYQRPWVINDRGQRFFWNGRDWDKARGQGRQGSDRRHLDYYGNSGEHRDYDQGKQRDSRRGRQRGRW